MRNFKEDWDLLLFTWTLCSIDTLGNNAVLVTKTDKFDLNKTKLVSIRRTITDDIVFFCIMLDVILI